MKKVVRFLICYIVSCGAVYLGGYGNLMNDISESLAYTTFFASALVLSVIAFLMLELYLSHKSKISELTARVERLEAESKARNDQAE